MAKRKINEIDLAALHISVRKWMERHNLINIDTPKM